MFEIPTTLRQLVLAVCLCLFFQAGLFGQSEPKASGSSDNLSDGFKMLLRGISEPPALDEQCSHTCFRLIRTIYPGAVTAIIRLEISDDGSAKTFTKVLSVRR